MEKLQLKNSKNSKNEAVSNGGLTSQMIMDSPLMQKKQKEHEAIFGNFKSQKTNSKNNDIYQLEPKVFKNKNAGKFIENIADKIDKETKSAHLNTINEIQTILNSEDKEEAVKNANFKGASKKRILAWSRAMSGDNDSLKAAATGYLIEDYVTDSVKGTKGIEAQVRESGARPDFVIYYLFKMGVVDLTSSKQVGHVMKKNFNKNKYSYIAESLYPQIKFSGEQIDFDMSKIKDDSLHKQIIKNASNTIGKRINRLAMICELLSNNEEVNYYDRKVFKQANIELKRRRDNNSSFWQTKHLRLKIDSDMETLNNKYGDDYFGLENPTDILTRVMGDYGVTFEELGIADKIKKVK